MNYMKTLTQHITERLHLNKDRIRKYEYQPKTTQELISVINEITHEQRNEKIINLNVIDTSKITDMSGVFKYRKNIYDISQWDVSGVTDMTSMFESSEFNGDISQWDVSHVENMEGMFFNSNFNNDISKWDVSNVTNMGHMFVHSKFNQDLTPWENKIKDKRELKYIKDYIK